VNSTRLGGHFTNVVKSSLILNGHLEFLITWKRYDAPAGYCNWRVVRILSYVVRQPIQLI